MNQEENVIVDKIQDTLSRDKEDQVDRLRREIERTRDEINLIKLKKERLETKKNNSSKIHICVDHGSFYN